MREQKRWRETLPNRPSDSRGGRVRHVWEAWVGKTLFPSRTARSDVHKEQHSIRRNGAPNMMGRCGGSTQLVSLTVVHALCARSVKDMVPPPKSPVASVLSYILSLSQYPKSIHLCVCLLRIRSSGTTGRDVSHAGRGCNGLGTTRSPSMLNPLCTRTLHPLKQAQRAHWRLNWEQRLSRNARPPVASPIEITVYGIPTVFAQTLGLRIA